MALNLDARQRAMLLEMGISVWLPGPSEALSVPVMAAAAVSDRPAPASRAAPAPSTAPSVPARASAAAAPASRAPAPAPTLSQPAATGWRLHPARAVYAPAKTADGAADGGWLILLEHPTATGLPAHPASAPDPTAAGTALEGDAARLLDNMLRALRLHQHPRVWSATLERETAQTTAAEDSRPLEDGLQAMVQTLRPARILVLGLSAARAVLGRSDALGRLRAEPHQVAGLPAVVTYDPGYLLRAAHAKPAAWADLCRARALNTP